MPRAAAVASDAESEPRSVSVRGQRAASARKSKPPTPEPEDDEDAEGSAEGSDEGDVYEVEAVLEHKYNAFGPKTTGYLVKWKGFGDEENSYIREEDAEGAKDLIKAYWKKHDAAKGGAGKRARGRSKASDADSDVVISKPPRGRKRASSEDVDMDAPASASKPAAGKKRRQQDAGEYVDMAAYTKRTTWEDIVERVDTVERKDGAKHLTVYLILTESEGGTKTHATSNQCRQKCPSKLFDFYEENLKWRDTGDGESI